MVHGRDKGFGSSFSDFFLSVKLKRFCELYVTCLGSLKKKGIVSTLHVSQVCL